MADIGLKEIFMEEVSEILKNLESEIIKLEEGDDPESINTIFRYVHTIKGSSGIADIPEISEFTHHIENLLDLVRNGKLEVGSDIIDIVLKSMDWVKMSIFSEDETWGDESLNQSLIVRIQEIIEGKSGEAVTEKEGIGVDNPVEECDIKPINKRGEEEESTHDINIEGMLGREKSCRYFKIKAYFEEDIFESGIDPIMIIDDLASLGQICEIKIDRDGLPAFDKLDPEKCYIGWRIILKTTHTMEKVNDVFLFVKDTNDIEAKDITSGFIEEGNRKEKGRSLQVRRLGDILIRKGVITGDDLNDVLDIQIKEKKKLGEIIVEKKLATAREVDTAILEQEQVEISIESTTVRVETKKLDNLMNLLGEIVIGQASISRLAEVLADRDEVDLIKNALYGLDRTTREFQEQIMTIRMIPIGPTFEQFRRFVRDSAMTMGKEISLEIEGGETELDKTVIEMIGDPLKHMIRNSIDHGVETPEDRERIGKNRKGRILLNAYHQEGKIFIDITDDGKGIDRKRLQEKALEVGLLGKGEEVSDEKLLSYLFVPGFSTAEKIGVLSGRGVGMDVVRRNIEDLRGTIDIITDEGKGTTIRIKLPLTLAIIEGMLVRIGNNIYIIPLLSIVESLRPLKNDVETIEGKGEVISVRGKYITFFRLYDFFGVESDYKNPWESLVVIVESNGTQLGLMVDDLIGQQQIVIKSLDGFITDNCAISGATILGDGRVALILDIHGLIGMIE